MTLASTTRQILVAATLGIGMVAAAVPADARSRFGGGGFHRSGFHGGFHRSGFHGGFAHRPFAHRAAFHGGFHRPFVHRPFVHHRFAHRPFYAHRHRHHGGVFAAGLVGGFAAYPAYYNYYTPAYYDQGACYFVRRPVLTRWGDVVIRRKWVCT
jgi:hypothetical protein